MTPALETWKTRVEPWHPGQTPGPGLRKAWLLGRSGFVRIRGVDLVRISSLYAADVLAVLRERGIPLGPVLVNVSRQCVEVVVPYGTAAAWPPLPYTRGVEAPVIRCPAPEVTSSSGRAPVNGRVWSTPPTAVHPPTTDPDELAAAVAAALARRAAPQTTEQRPARLTGGTSTVTDSTSGRAICRDLRPVAPYGLASRPAINGLHAVHEFAGQSLRSPRAARDYVTSICRTWRIPRTVAEDLRTIVSELVANAVVHTRSETVSVTVTLTAEEAAVEVADPGPQRLVTAAEDIDEHGRGLDLVEARATRVYAWPDGDGTSVWAAIRLPERVTSRTPHEDDTDAPRTHP